MRRLLLTSMLISSGVVVFGQATKSTAKPASAATAAPKGRNISITLTPLKNCKVYLGSYYGSPTNLVLMDSAVLNEKSQGAFKGATKLTGGIYFVVTPQMTRQFDILMDNKQQFSIVADTAQKEKAVITGSVDNDLFKNYAAFTDTKGRRREQLLAEYRNHKGADDSVRIAAELAQIDSELTAYRNDITKKYPNSLLAV
jgi:hypothetical protein